MAEVKSNLESTDTERVWLWSPWQADPAFYHGTPVDVPRGWRVLGMYQAQIVLISVPCTPTDKDGQR